MLPDVAASRRALAGFFLSGLLLSFVGAIMPAWGYHLRPNFLAIGNYFLSVVVGVVLAVSIARRVIAKVGLADALGLGCFIAFTALVALSFAPPPVSEIWRLPGLLTLGLGAGLVNTAIILALSPAFEMNSAATINVAGIFFGLGSIFSPLLMAGTFNLYTVSFSFYAVALVPAAFAVFYARLRFPSAVLTDSRPAAQTQQEFATPAAVLLSALLFFHFGNEWSIAGWLPLLLILRLGLNPVTALMLLALYWLAIMLGRIAAQAVLPRISHPKLLLGSIIGALFGCLLLGFTNNLFGATLGTLLIGFGFAPIYPLVVEAIRNRFPHYQPGLFNGIFSIGLTGECLRPQFWVTSLTALV